MQKIAVLLQGVTFFRAAAAMIHFARAVGVDLTVLYPKQRAGKEYDTIDSDELSQFAPHVRQLAYAEKQEIPLLLRKQGIGHVVAQDASHHYPELWDDPDLRIYSISAFIDTLHHAQRVARSLEEKYIPHKLYFPCTYIENKFFEIGSYSRDELQYAALGSPALDHRLFIDQAEDRKLAVYIAPPPELYRLFMTRAVARLFRHLKQHGYRLIVKDRVKTPLPRQLAHLADEHHTDETIMPYASIDLISKATIHICGFSTSIFEARLLNKPTLNLDINLEKHSMGNFVQAYKMSDLYNSATCKTERTHLIKVFDQLTQLPASAYDENKAFIAPNQDSTMKDNASIRIWSDIIQSIAVGK